MMDFVLDSPFSSIELLTQKQENPHPQQKQKCEIKEESIKSESSENQQSNNQQNPPQEPPQSTSEQTENDSSDDLEIVEISWFKCDKCFFLGISQSTLDSHTCNESERTKYDCPGCENVFYSTNSLQIHLLEDHRMLQEELEAYQNQLSDNSRKKKKKSKTNEKHKRKSRIYIKNVQLLKKPQESPGKSKIYIKDVQLLRKPTLSQTFPDNLLDGFDCLEDDLSHFNPFNPAHSDFGQETSEIQSSGEYQPQIYVRSMENMNSSQEHIEYYEENSAYQTEAMDASNQQETDRRSKIFIKNISVLKEPNLIHPNLFNTDNNQSFPSIHLKSVDELNSTFDLANNHQVTTASQTMTSSSTITSQLLDFSMESHDHNMDYSFMSQATINSNQETIILDNYQIGDSQQLPYTDPQQEALHDLINFNIPSTSSNNFNSKFQDFGGQDFLVIPPESDPHPIQEILPVDDLQDIPASGTLDTIETLNVSGSDMTEDDRYQHHEESSEVPETVVTENLVNQEDILTIEIQDDDQQITEVTPKTIENPADKSVSSENSQPRIYVASNLMKDSSQKNKGRPKGAKKLINGNTGESDKQFRCGFEKCGCRFSTLEKVQYHRQCHSKENEHGIICPECKGSEWKNWNSLHTHMWRAHEVDMELYKCDQCNFKTPNLSLLNNMHVKIHQEDRNFICNVSGCEKAFKNSKQLKNHRRTHRLNEAKQALLEKSKDGVKIVTESGAIICVTCHKSFPNETSLQMHAELHNNRDGKNYQCSKCSFITNDHNSFRRHNSKHADYHPYKCKFCSYTSIQSSTYRKHIEKRHPEEVQNILFKCSKCKFTTINKIKFDHHQNKHDEEVVQKPPVVLPVASETLPPVATIQEPIINVDQIADSSEVLIISDSHSDTNLLTVSNQNKIKVKSNLVLTDPNKYVNLSCSGFLHDILPNQISNTPQMITIPIHQPMIRPAIFAKMDGEQNQQNLDTQGQHFPSTIDPSFWTSNS